MTNVDDNIAVDLAATLEQARARLQASHQTQPGDVVAREFSEDMDAMLRTYCDAMVASNESLWGRARERFAIVATGGYGRRELNLYSDIDLLFLFEEEPQEADARFIKALLYPLWNLKLVVGYSVKTIRQVIAEIGSDINTTTSLIGTHTIWGNEAIAASLLEQFRLEVSLRHSESLTAEILGQMRERHAKFQNTRLLLQPNIKDSPGGLRDIHTLRWICFIHYGDASLSRLTNEGLATTQEEKRLRFAHSFLIGLRNAMHLLENKKNDQLTVERQIKVAAEWGIRSIEHLLPEEQLMRQYYDHTGAVDRLANRVLKKFSDRQRHTKGIEKKPLRATRLEGPFWMRGDQIWVDPKQVANLLRDPSWMMQLFSIAAHLGLNPDDFTLNFVEHRAGDVNDAMRRSPMNRDRFLMILKNPKFSAQTLRHMHRCRFLDVYIPEFALVRNLPRIDYYHQYTVDEHLLRCVYCAVELFDSKSDFSKSHVALVARDIMRWDLLVFALLLHDVGKGEGRGHVIRGAHIMQRISERMDLMPREARILHELVLNHQKLSTLALRRNPDDPRIPQELAADIGDPEMLRMLYVLTCCDMRGVSNQSWNDWRASLLASLYERTMDVLLGRSGSRRKKLSHADMLASVMAEFEKNCMVPVGDQKQHDELHREVESLLSDLPDRYRETMTPAAAARHVCLARRLSDKELVAWEVELVPRSGYAYIHCVARDMPGLFTNLCGAFTSRGLNIVEAQIHTATNGICIDVFKIQGAGGEFPEDEGVLERLRIKLNKVLRGERQADWTEHLPRKEAVVSSAMLDQRPPVVTINNEGDESRTIIEVSAPDRAGLLFDITSVLDRHRLNIDLALVATGPYAVADVFYVTDWENNRLESGPRTEKLRKELLDVVSPRNPVVPQGEASGVQPPASVD